MGFIEELIGLVVFIAFLYGCYKIPKMLIVNGSKAYKHNRNTMNIKLELPSSINGRTEQLNEIDRIEGTDLVRFPESINPNQEYYITGLRFTPSVQDYDVTIKGKPAKRGHYVRNTVLFGLIGTAATHDKAATPDKHYNYQTEGRGEGTMYIISRDLTAKYHVTFYGNTNTANRLKRFLTDDEHVRNAYARIN